MSTLQLNQFYGSDRFTRWTSLSNSVLSEGALYVAETAGAFWLFDAIQSYIDENEADWVQTELTVHADNSATLTLTGENEELLSRWKVPFTDFPESELRIWSVRLEFNTFTHMLPSEW